MGDASRRAAAGGQAAGPSQPPVPQADVQAVQQSLLLLREVRSKGSGSISKQQSLARIEQIPVLLSSLLGESGAEFSQERRQLALEKLSDVVARVDVAAEHRLREMVERTGLVVVVVMC